MAFLGELADGHGHAYRLDATLTPAQAQRLHADLCEARDALDLTVLLLDSGPGKESGDETLARVARARLLLVEAARALGRARVHRPQLRSVDVAAIVGVDVTDALESRVDVEEARREAHRLHAIASGLLWANVRWFPAKRAAAPLSPDDEAQLARLVSRRWVGEVAHGLLGYRGLIAGTALLCAAPWLGAPLAVAGAVIAARTTWSLLGEPSADTAAVP